MSPHLILKVLKSFSVTTYPGQAVGNKKFISLVISLNYCGAVVPHIGFESTVSASFSQGFKVEHRKSSFAFSFSQAYIKWFSQLGFWYKEEELRHMFPWPSLTFASLHTPVSLERVGFPCFSLFWQGISPLSSFFLGNIKLHGFAWGWKSIDLKLCENNFCQFWLWYRWYRGGCKYGSLRSKKKTKKYKQRILSLLQMFN